MKKPNIGLLKAFALCARYKKLSPSEQAKVQEQRLRALVAYAKEHSPYYAGLYKGIGENFALSDLPPVNKVDLMAHFDDWVADPAVRLADVRSFMENLDNIGRKFRGEYLVFTTSGSTGSPLVALCDKTANNVMSALGGLRGFAKKSDLGAFVKRGARTIGVFADSGFYLGNSSARARLLAAPWKKSKIGITSALLPIERIVHKLNEFQPILLGGYPTILELLIDEQQSGRLHIAPSIVMAGGEYLSDDLRARLRESFGCTVQTTYSCTEGGTVACECEHERFHVNEDWLIVEPVDGDNNPVPDGVRGDKILLTNLYNFSQPFIRYEVSDRVALHREACPCGNPAPWLTIEGRTDDIVRLTQDGKVIAISPLAIYATIKEVHEVARFQLLAHSQNRLELRLVPAPGMEKAAAFTAAESSLRVFLATHGVTRVDIALATEEPMRHPQSGKFKHVMVVK